MHFDVLLIVSWLVAHPSRSEERTRFQREKPALGNRNSQNQPQAPFRRGGLRMTMALG